MTSFSAIDIGRTGMGFARYWIDNLAHNLANANTIHGPEEEPFRARLVVARPNGDQIVPTGSGVHVSDVVVEEREADRVHAPDHPLADDEGYVTLPVIDLAGQMTDMMIANRSYQANARTVQTAREAYETALRLGQRG